MGLSSARSMRKGKLSASRGMGLIPVGNVLNGAARVRMVKLNFDPLPGVLSTLMWPFMSCTRRSEMVRPRPEPPYLRDPEESTCENE